MQPNESKSPTLSTETPGVNPDTQIGLHHPLDVPLGPKPQRLSNWASYHGDQIRFQLLCLTPMSKSEATYTVRTLLLAMRQIARCAEVDLAAIMNEEDNDEYD